MGQAFCNFVIFFLHSCIINRKISYVQLIYNTQTFLTVVVYRCIETTMTVYIHDAIWKIEKEEKTSDTDSAYAC